MSDRIIYHLRECGHNKVADALALKSERIEQLEAGIRQIQENYMKRGLIKRLTSQLLYAGDRNHHENRVGRTRLDHWLFNWNGYRHSHLSSCIETMAIEIDFDGKPLYEYAEAAAKEATNRLDGTWPNDFLLVKLERSVTQLLQECRGYEDAFKEITDALEQAQAELKLYRPNTSSENHCCPACGREYGLRKRIDKLETALQEIVDATPANKHKKWPHHHFYLTKAQEALEPTEEST